MTKIEPKEVARAPEELLVIEPPDISEELQAAFAVIDQQSSEESEEEEPIRANKTKRR